MISTHAPAGGATLAHRARKRRTRLFLLTPLREGRRRQAGGAEGGVNFYSRPCGRGDQRGGAWLLPIGYFYSRPCGRGDTVPFSVTAFRSPFLLTPLREGRPHANGIAAVCEVISTHAPAGGATETRPEFQRMISISTHAPAGGATAIFHKSVMRFCGKLPKDDTVLCLASFGFPRRDPKAVYLAWISCANLPQKCVRQGLALKDQGTSCFHEGLASHAFDPVLV